MPSSEPGNLPAGGRFTRLTVDDGLPTNDVRSIAQDHQGFIWLGTSNAGVCRYDGYEFYQYEHDPDDPSSLSHNFAWTMLVDRSGNLWVATAGGGLDRYDPTIDGFVHYRNNPTNPATLPHNTVLSLYEDSAGQLWVGTRAGLSLYDANTGYFRNYARAPDPKIGPNLNSVRCVMEDRETGLLWVGTSDSLCAFDPASGNFVTVLRRSDGPVAPGYNSVNDVVKDASGLFWVSTERGLLRFRPRLTSIPEPVAEPIYTDFEMFTHEPDDPESLPSEYIRDSLIDRRGRFWLATQSGLALLDRSTGRCQVFKNRASDPESIGANLSHRVFEDSAGNLWITSQNNGVSRLNAWDKEFTNYRRVLGDPNSLCHDTVTALLIDRFGNLWAGTVDGLSRFDGERWRTYRHNHRDDTSLSSNNITALAEDRDGGIWVGTATDGLNRLVGGAVFERFERQSGDPVPAHGSRLPYTHNQISGLSPDPRGGIWVGARAWGLDYFDGTAFLHFATVDNTGARLPVDYAVFGHFSGDGALYFGTEQYGLVELDLKTGALQSHLVDPAVPGSSVNKYVNTVYHAGGDTLWLGTLNGLFRYSLSEGKFTGRYTQADGLPADSVISIVADLSGTLWIGTGAGLVEFDPVSGVRRAFDRADGLPSNQMAARAATRGPDGRIYIGTSDGIAAFFPEELRSNPVAPPVAITRFELYDSTVRPGRKGSPLERSIHTGGHLVLQPDQLNFTFRFAAMDFTAPIRNRYAFRMEGYDADWRYTDGRQRLATYTNLPPGDYVFRVRGSNNDGVWNEEGASVGLTILAPWWSTAWFRTSAILSLILSAVVGYRWRVRHIARRSAQLEGLVAERTHELEIARDQAEAASRAKSTFLANMSHELRTPLNSVLGYAQILQREPQMGERQRAALATIRQSGEHLLTLINDILDLARVVAGRIDLVVVDVHLRAFLRGITEIVRVRLEEKSLRLATDYADDLPLIVRTDQTRLRQVLLNLLGNAVRFTDHGVVTFRVRRVGTVGADGRSRLRFEVEDTGIGMSPEQVNRLFRPFEQVAEHRRREGGAGLGLAISRQLVELMGGEIEVVSTLGRGSRFSFELDLETVDEPPRASSSAGMITGYEGRRRRLVIVDDTPGNRAALADAMLALDFSVRETTSGEAALEVVRQDRPDLVLMDLTMPGIGGLEAMRRLRREPGSEDLPIIALSSASSESDRAAAAEAGAVEFVAKPFELAALYAAIGRVLRLTWVRRSAAVAAPPEETAAASVFSAPPADELEVLWALAIRGDMRGVRARADHLASLGGEYEPLAIHLRELADAYRSRAILATIRQFGRPVEKA